MVSSQEIHGFYFRLDVVLGEYAVSVRILDVSVDELVDSEKMPESEVAERIEKHPRPAAHVENPGSGYYASGSQ